MTDKGKCLRSPRIFVWFKEPFVTTNASRILIDQNDYVIDFVERVIKEDQLEHATTTKPSLFNVIHKGEIIPHDTRLEDISGITTKDPLIIEQIENCKF